MATHKSGNPSGSEVATAPWVEAIAQAWRYPRMETMWFLEKLEEVPADACIAGMFCSSLFELLRRSGHDSDAILGYLHFAEWPSRFQRAPLNHYLLASVETAHRLGYGRDIGDDLGLIQSTVNRAMVAAIIRRTLPGVVGEQRVEEHIAQVAKAFSGVFFSHTTVDVEEVDDGWTLHHRREYNFLAHYHYAAAYEWMLGGAESGVQSVRFEWVGPAAADVHVVTR